MKSRFAQFYRNTCGFALLSILATMLTVAADDKNFMCTIWFGALAIGDFIETTRTLYKMYKIECRSRRH